MRIRLPFGFPFRRRGSAGDPASDAPSGDGFVEPVSRRTTPGQVAGCGAAFFGVFLLVGLAFLAVFVVPAVRVVQAFSWDPVPCEILASSVAFHSGEDSGTYSVEVSYRYSIAGRDYTASRYRFLSGSSSGSEGKQRVVDSLPPGTVTTCWVDPGDPSEAVLDRGFHWEYLFALLPLIFVAVGAGGIVFSLKKARRMGARDAVAAPAWLPPGPAESPGGAIEPGAAGAARFAASAGGSDAFGAFAGETSVLEPKLSPFGKLGGIVAISLFWNGIVSLFVWQLWKTWQAGEPDGCLAVFLIPFVLVGVLLLIGIPYQLLALFNPRPRLVLSPGRLVLGRAAELSWSFRGAAGRIRRLLVTLEGREEADYTRGTDRHTDRQVFTTITLVDSALRSAIAAGSVRVDVPAGTMHSFSAPDNRIVWTLKLHGSIRMWPDVLEELPVVIEPGPVGTGS